MEIDRRGFLKAMTAGAALTILPRRVVGGTGAPSAKLNVGVIGVGQQGASNLRQLEGENVVALCDVDRAYSAKAVARHPQAKFYTDYREMLAHPELDAVLIATPDHTHAVIALAAMRAGKHVFCQKPLTRTVMESRLLARAAREAGVVTQMGIQGHSGDGIRLVSEWIAAGLIGDVREVDAWCSLTYYPWGHATWSTKWGEGRPKDTPPVPEDLAWDLWLGPAPERPYHPAYHPRAWRCWWDFGCGMMGDRGVHTFDPIVTALKLGAPESVDATSCGMNEELHPLASIVTYQFPAGVDGKPVKVTWYEGTRPPRPAELEDGRKLPEEGGSIFKGTRGKIMCGVYGESPRIIPEKLMQSAKRPEPTIARIAGGTNGHVEDWLRAIREGGKAGADFEYSGPLTETCLLGNVAKRSDTRIKWDAETMKVTNLEEANAWVGFEPRAGWAENLKI